jgi:hypothetical protein
MEVVLLWLILGPGGIMFSVLICGFVLPVAWLVQELRTRGYTSLVLGLGAIVYAFLLGYSGAAHRRSLEGADLIRVLQQSRQYSENSDAEALSAELDQALGHWASGRPVHQVLREFRGPSGEGDPPREQEDAIGDQEP